MQPRFEEGREVVELGPSGLARWIPALFLSFWLCGWLMGEVAGVALLLGAAGILSGAEIRWLPRAGGAAAAPAMLFALVWTSFWTLGGFLAAREVLRLLFGSDRIEYDGAGVRRVSRIGPFASTRIFPREQIRALALLRGRLALVTGAGMVALTRFGSSAEQAELKDRLERALALGSGDATATDALPAGWETEVDMEGVTVLRRAPAVRRRRATFISAATVLLAAVAALLIRKAATGVDPRVWVPAAIFTLFAGAAGIGAAWLIGGGTVLRLRSGQAEMVRWFGSTNWTRSFAPPSLALERSFEYRDERYLLAVRGPGGATTVASAVGQPYELLVLGRWMAEKLGCELRLPPELQRKSDAA